MNTTKTCEVLAWCPVEDDTNIPEYVETLTYSHCQLILTGNACDNVWICNDSVHLTGFYTVLSCVYLFFFI